MQFKSSYFLKDRLGEQRIVRKFLLIPRTFGSKRTRWLERADILEKVKECYGEWGEREYRWIEIGFADEVLGFSEKRRRDG